MFRFEVRGYIRKGEENIPFVTVTPPCMNAYQASLYVVGKLGDTDVVIDYGTITRIID